jgi:acetyl esterase/lipase
MKRAIRLVVLAVVALLVLVPSASAQQEVTYGSGPPQTAHLYAAGDGAPVLVWVTGGGWVLNDPAIARPFASALQAEGITVLVPRYTLGAPETAAADLVQAVAFADRLPGRGRLTLGGHSAGAHLAALIALDGRVNADGLLLASGVYDLAGTVQDGGLAAWLVQQAFGSSAARWQSQSPQTYVRADVPPIWIVQGARDTDTNPARAATFATRLAEAGAPVTQSTVPAGHLDTPVALLRQRDELRAFLRSGPMDGARSATGTQRQPDAR